MTHEHRHPPGRTRLDGDRRRRLLALGAGGLVLGVGATAVFAAWTDTEQATASFAAGQFGIRSSVDGGVWHDDAGTSVPVTFPSLATKLSPGDAVSTAYAVSLTPTSDYQAVVSLTNATASSADIAPDLAYRVVRVTDMASCDATTDGLGVVAQANSFGTPGTGDAPTTSAPFTLASTSDVVYLCFQVGAKNTLAQGDSGAVTWTFTATSGDRLG